MFEEQNKIRLELLKKHEENVTSIINDKISNINPLQPGVAFLYPLKTTGCNGLIRDSIS